MSCKLDFGLETDGLWLDERLLVFQERLDWLADVALQRRFFKWQDYIALIILLRASELYR